MKKIIAIFLFFIFLFNYMGYYIAFKIAQSEIRKETANTIFSHCNASKNKPQFTTLTFYKSEIHTIDFRNNGKEISLDNKMYDIVKRLETKNTITFYCVIDKKETKLNNTLSIHFDKNILNTNSDKSKTSKNITNNMIKLFMEDYPELLTVFQISSQLNYSNKVDLYSSLSQKVNSPPPEFA